MNVHDYTNAGKSFRQQMIDAIARQAERAAKKQVHSTFWLPNIEKYRVTYANPVTRVGSEYIMALASIRRGISNFVKIMTGRDVPVHFSTGQQSWSRSATTETVVISATMDPDKFDVNVGLALHEAAHLIKSKYSPSVENSIPLFAFLDVLNNKHADFFTPAMIEDMKRLELPEVEARKLLKTIINVMEDRRIDKWMYETAFGYRRYYDAMYHFYWNSEEITEQFSRPVARIPLIRIYRFHIVNIMNPASDPSMLPGLQEIHDLLDIDTIERFGKDKKWFTYESSAFPEVREVKDGPSGKITKIKTGKIKYPLLQLPDMIQTAIGVVGIILANAKLVSEVKKEAYVLPMIPIEVVGRGMDEESSDEEAPLVSIPTFDRNNYDSNDPDPDAKPTPSPDKDTENLDESQEDVELDGVEDEPDDSDSDTDADDGTKQDSKGTAGDDTGDNKSNINTKSNSTSVSNRPLPSTFDKDYKDIDKALDEQDKLLNGDVEKEVIGSNVEEQLKALEGAGAELHMVDGVGVDKVEVIVYSKLTMQLLASPSFIFSTAIGGVPVTREKNVHAINEGIQMGNILAHRLRVMADESPLTYTRQSSGKLDKRLIHGLGFGQEQVFAQTLTERYSPVFLHLSIDSSTSMAGIKFENSLRLAVALAQASLKIPTLDVVISFRASSDLPEVLIGFDSRINKMEHIKTLFRHVNVGGGTPEGLAFAALKDRITDAKITGRKFFVNLSDGYPAFNFVTRAVVNGQQVETHQEYNGELAWKHTARQIRDIRDADIDVLSYFITSIRTGDKYDTKQSRAGFDMMYGKSATYINPDSVLEIATSLNKLFLDKE